jgi:signal transduction histidine kinase/ActR/RegA family two-component response regulator
MSSPASPRSASAPNGGSPWRRAVAWLRRRVVGDGRRALDQAELRAEQAEARLRAAVDALPEGLVFLDREGRYILWNKRYAEIYHRSADLFAPGAKLIDTLRVGVARGDYPDAVGREEAWLAARMALLENPGVRHEQRVSDGRWLMIEERRTSDGGVIGLRVDITDMKRQAEALEVALQRAEAANRAKDEFLANLSHEIRTPLNGVLGLADVLGRTALDPAQRDLLDTIITSAGALDHILTDLLDFSRLEAGRLEIAKEPFALAQAVGEVAAMFELAARERGVILNVEVAEGAARTFLGDAGRLKQILANLLGNALKFTEQGRVDLVVAPGAKGDRCYFEVRDTGIGFDPHDAERLFARFEQADGSFTRKYGGAGLGLAISRQLAELMGGSISAAGQRGRGAVFTLILPLKAVEPDLAVAPEAEPATPANGAVEAVWQDEAGPENERPLRVLVVDDNETNRKVAELILQAIGADVVCVENGREGVDAVEQGEYDLVLMDLQMPVMDGLAAIRAIRAREAAEGLPATPVVVLSANVMHQHIEASTAAGANGHLGKPIRAEALITAVSQAVMGEPLQAAAANA